MAIAFITAKTTPPKISAPPYKAINVGMEPSHNQAITNEGELKINSYLREKP